VVTTSEKWSTELLLGIGLKRPNFFCLYLNLHLWIPQENEIYFDSSSTSQSHLLKQFTSAF
jgi:hypothetical protein